MTTCPHCGETLRSHQAKHVRHCLANPALADRLRTFLHSHATDGRLMTLRDYNRLCADADLPSADVLLYRFRVWHAVAEWAGLERGLRGVGYGNQNAAKPWKPRPEGSRPRPPKPIDAPVEPLDPRPPERVDWPEGLKAWPGTLVVAAWDAGAERYVPARAECGWMRLW